MMMQVYRKAMSWSCQVICLIREKPLFIYALQLGAGTILASVATASGCTPTILGKPYSAMFDAIRSAFPDVDPKRTVMIGDR